ncbi:head-tail adaptor protein [Sinirhodobacter huangdaonensis]|uniref:Head-tail adaptor protein n=1 Tax=Paenirhodobacter huangdaonensis TaxID=2501515 RepID=A0A3S3PEK2_9RHOB|nr:head-tail adaptor protein [Sinirhodobacter huangdaonensis]RWR50352.1 head-tail adaptor protein [Sinirhodobacter huangdaonensis]
MGGSTQARIRFERATRSPDGAGGARRVWAALDRRPEVWARVRAGSGGESFEGGRVNATAMVVFRLRRRSDLTPLDRILWQGVAYNIRTLLPAAGSFMEIEAERGVPS